MSNLTHQQDRSQPSASTEQRLCVVTVTYGERLALLERMLEAVGRQGVREVVVVDNGSTGGLAGLSDRFPLLRLHVESMGMNTGSAVGFGKGIDVALALGVDMVWLLDDDNLPLEGALVALLTNYKRFSEQWPRNKLAALAYRPDHQSGVAGGVKGAKINPRASSFLGFHVLDIPQKLAQRLSSRRGGGTPPSVVRLDTAPYSGLLFHRDLVQTIGLPRQDFVLYSDDIEWTYRISRSGGCIMLVTESTIEDMESSWNVKEKGGSAISTMLDNGGDFRAYYGVRNAAYFFTHLAAGHHLTKLLNRRIYILLLWIGSRRAGRRARYKLLRRAISDGVRGHLGVVSDYSL